MAQTGFSFIALLFATITGIIHNPPEDLLSLSNTKAVLTELKVEQSEENLIALLSSSEQAQADSSELDKAVKLLREGNFKERKMAKKVLNAAGEEHKDYFIKMSSDADPEVSETAKSILNKFTNKTKIAKDLGMTDDVLKILAIRRLTEMKSTQSLKAIQNLVSSKNTDIAIEAKRALTIIQGKVPERASRNEGTQKLLKMIPQEYGFIAALDLTAPSQKTSLEDYLAPMKNIPGMDTSEITNKLHKSIPMFLQKVGNPQIDSIIFVSSKELAVDNKTSWVGFIGTGRYNSKKVKALLKEQGLEQKKENGFDYWTERWGPSVCPVDDEVIIISLGDPGSNHMAKMLENVKGEETSATALISTENNRLVAAGKLSKKQKEMMKLEIGRDLERAAGRNGNNAEAERAIMELALLCTASESFTGKLEDRVVIIQAEMDNAESAKKMIKVIEKADQGIRTVLKDIPLPIFKGFNLEKRFTKSEVNGKSVTLKVKSEILDMMTMLPLMMMRKF